jgi:membrane-associated phospholipid phosphatase
VALALALAALTALVAAGALTRLDQYAVDHLMPWLRPSARAPDLIAGLYRPFALRSANWRKVLDLWTYPCSVLISGLVVAYAAVRLWRPYGLVVALAPAAAWLVGNGLEVLGKHTITRPALDRQLGPVRVHVAAFDDSYPSGHMIRGLLVAFTIALLWPRATRAVAVWVLLVAVALVVAGDHTPTDVGGGILTGLILLTCLAAAPGATRAERGRARAVPGGSGPAATPACPDGPALRQGGLRRR